MYIYCERRSNDREDFIEDSIQLRHAIKHGVVAYKEGLDITGKKVIGHGKTPPGNPLWPNRQQVNLASAYFNTKTFKEYARREFKICKFAPDAIVATIEEMGLNKAAIKHIGPKQTPLCFLKTTKDVVNQLYDFYEYEFARLDGDNCLVQEFVTMYNEYRVFVVDGKPITGAGCVEDDTPLENVHLFNHCMQKVRGHSPSLGYKDLAQEYKFAAKALARSFAQEGLRDYALDLFYHPDSKTIGIIELNPISHSGFYAIDYSRLFEAIHNYGEM